MEESQDITGGKSVKVNCSFCIREIECPEPMLQTSKKHMCYECFRNAGELTKGEGFEDVHVDIPMDKMDEIIPENLTNSIVEEVFPDIWKERKEEFKGMSKRDLAEEMFGAGTYIAIRNLLLTIKKVGEKKDNPKTLDGQGTDRYSSSVSKPRKESKGINSE